MTGRPCKPEADLKRIWQMLLPGTPFPSCGAGYSEPKTSERVEPVSELRSDEPRAAARE